MRYSLKEAQLLYDTLPLAEPITGKLCGRPLYPDHNDRSLFRIRDYAIIVQSAQHVYEIIGINVTVKAWGKDICNLLQYRMNVRKICHEIPLEEVPLYINDEAVKYIAAWRLRIAQ
jgi:hypothetical protein